MVLEKILKTIKEHHLIENDQHIIIGLSGGPDSVCLFDVLKKQAKVWNLSLYPVHVNHQFRPGEAEEDQEFVETICAQSGYPCRTFVFDCKEMARREKITSEEAGRKARYQAFAEVASELTAMGVNPQSIGIAVAQNADDQAETILFRILRGAGTDGISGIRYKRRDQYGNQIIRPMLDIPKEEILSYCEEQQIKVCIDKTNLEPIYARNKIRLQLIPYLEKEYNTNIKDTMVRMGKIAATDKDFLWQEAQKQFMEIIKEKTENTLILDGEKLRRVHRSIRQRVVSLALGEIGLTEDVSYAHYECCESIIFNEKPSARVDLPHGYYLTKIYQDIQVAQDQKPKTLHGFLIKKMTHKEYEAMEYPKNSHIALDFQKVKTAFGDNVEDQIGLRYRKAGDFIAIAKDGTKKIQDFLVDQKIPKDHRDQMEMITIGSEVLWIVPGKYKGRYTAKYKIDFNTKNVICIEIFGSI